MSRELASGEYLSSIVGEERLSASGEGQLGSRRDQLVLAIETTAPSPGVALARANGADVCVVAEDYATRRGARAEGLAACVRSVLERAGLEARQLSGIAVIEGPGSYTGLRVGLALARGLALVDGLPLVAVGSLELMVEAAGSQSPTCALLDASHEKLFMAGFARERGVLRQAHETSIVAVAELRDCLRAWGGDWKICADAELARSLEANVVAPNERAAVLARLGVMRLANGLGVAAEAVLPRYVGATGARPAAVNIVAGAAIAALVR